MAQQPSLPLAERDGFTLYGEFVGVKDGKPWTGRDGNLREPVNVSLLAGQSLRRVQFQSMADARYWLGGSIPERGARVGLPVYPRARANDLYLDGARAPREEEAVA